MVQGVTFGSTSSGSVALGQAGKSVESRLAGSDEPNVSSPCLEDGVAGDAEPPSRPRFLSAPLGLRLFGDECLKVPALPVESLETLDRRVVAVLAREMKKYAGLGMAAQQVGGTQRVCVAALSTHGSGKPGAPRSTVVLINPRLLDHAPNTVVCTQEGCLSVPGFRTSTRRYPWIVVEWENERFETQTARVEGLDAQIVQHEMDHLAGRCIADGVSRQQRRQAEKLVASARRQA
ncbi:MAG: peptide deformylase [Gemmatimonadetes bacterium]|nr:peptide deformylase [Gemmatimonadota bacterium]